MLELFRNNHLSNSILLIPYIFLLRIKFFFSPWVYVPNEYDTPLSAMFFNFMSNKLWLSFILGGIIVFFISMIANIVVMKYRVSRDQTLFPALIFALASSVSVHMLTLNPALISTLFVGLALVNLVNIYKKPLVASQLLNAGLLLAISQLFYSSTIAFIVLGFAAIIVLRSPKIPEYLQYLSGWGAVYFLLFTILFWNDSLTVLSKQFDFGLAFDSIFTGGGWQHLISIIILVLWIVVCIISFQTFTMKKNLQAIKNITIVYWIFLCGFFSLFFAHQIRADHFYIITIPSAVFGALFLEKIQRNALAEAAHILTLIIIFYFQFS